MFKTDGTLTKGRDFKEISLCSDVSTEEWNDWHWQLRNRITDVEELSKVIDMTPDEWTHNADDLVNFVLEKAL